jgi:protein-disulfide isomerase
MMSTLKVPVTSDDHIQGDERAPIVLVEYGDYECPQCGRAYPIVKRLQKHFGKRLGFVFRNFPLSEIHPNAASAAEAAEFAGANGRFWEMHDGIFVNQDTIGLPLLLTVAEALGLSTTDLNSALTSHEYAPRIKRDFMGGVRSGVNGTPTFFINGHQHAGTSEFDDLVAGIESRGERS